MSSATKIALKRNLMAASINSTQRAMFALASYKDKPNDAMLEVIKLELADLMTMLTAMRDLSGTTGDTAV